METALEKLSEKALLERELNEIMEATFRMEYELEIVLKEAGSR
ncbi:MAG: hypothetical protein WD876_04065 [Candidatus Pacearchaeota archaeon]